MKKTALILTLLLCPAVLSGQSHSAGIFNSLKGFGFSVSNSIDSDEFNTFTLIADFYGVLSGRSETPGVSFNYTHNHVIRTHSYQDLFTAFYAGSGASLGFVHDFERGSRIPYIEELTRNYGLYAALSGTVGYRFLFQRRISIDLSWSVEAGLHFRQDENDLGYHLNLYKNGFLNALYPQLKLEYYF